VESNQNVETKAEKCRVQNSCCNHMSDFKDKMQRNPISAVALPQTPLGELIAFPKLPSWNKRGLLLRGVREWEKGWEHRGVARSHKLGWTVWVECEEGCPLPSRGRIWGYNQKLINTLHNDSIPETPAGKSGVDVSNSVHPVATPLWEGMKGWEGVEGKVGDKREGRERGGSERSVVKSKKYLKIDPDSKAVGYCLQLHRSGSRQVAVLAD